MEVLIRHYVHHHYVGMTSASSASLPSLILAIVIKSCSPFEKDSCFLIALHFHSVQNFILK